MSLGEEIMDKEILRKMMDASLSRAERRVIHYNAHKVYWDNIIDKYIIKYSGKIAKEIPNVYDYLSSFDFHVIGIPMEKDESLMKLLDKFTIYTEIGLNPVDIKAFRDMALTENYQFPPIAVKVTYKKNVPNNMVRNSWSYMMLGQFHRLCDIFPTLQPNFGSEYVYVMANIRSKYPSMSPCILDKPVPRYNYDNAGKAPIPAYVAIRNSLQSQGLIYESDSTTEDDDFDDLSSEPSSTLS